MAGDLAKIINGTSTVTDAMKIDLGLSVRATPGPVPRPSDAPGVDVVSVTDRTVTVHIHDSAESTKRGKPEGTTRLGCTASSPRINPSDPSQWSFEGASTKSTFQIAFDNALPSGTQVWICAAWINDKQEAGPPSTPVTTNLQGGGTSAVPAMKVAA